jgi:hypothetical protein
MSQGVSNADNPLDVAKVNAVRARETKLTEMQSAGKTDGISYFNGMNPPDAIYQRSWATEADAQEWIDYLSTFDHVDSAVIEPEGATWTSGYVLWSRI